MLLSDNLPPDFGQSHAEEALLQQPLRVSQQEGGEVHVGAGQPPHVSQLTCVNR